MFLKKKIYKSGQATVEYLLLAVTIIIIARVILSPLGKGLTQYSQYLLGPYNEEHAGYYGCLMQNGLLPTRIGMHLKIGSGETVSCAGRDLAALQLNTELGGGDLGEGGGFGINGSGGDGSGGDGSSGNGSSGDGSSGSDSNKNGNSNSRSKKNSKSSHFSSNKNSSTGDSFSDSNSETGNSNLSGGESSPLFKLKTKKSKTGKKKKSRKKKRKVSP